jgi:hypothetical protein
VEGIGFPTGGGGICSDRDGPLFIMYDVQVMSFMREQT